MKKILSVIIVAAFAALTVISSSCNKSETEEKIEIGNDYSGTITCTVGTTDYPTEGIKVSVVEGEAENTLIITMYEVRFVPQMPITMTFNLGPIDYKSASKGSVSLSASGTLIPYTEVATYEKYAVSEFKGTIGKGTISLSMNFATPMGTVPTTYEGIVISE